MNRGLVLFCLASFFLTPTASQAQLAYQPKIRVADKAESYQVKIMDAMKMTTTKVVDGTGKVLAERKKEAKSKSYVYNATILAKGADSLHPAASKRAYEKAELTDNGNTRAAALQGKTVILEKKGNKFGHRFEDSLGRAPADAESARFLRELQRGVSREQVIREVLASHNYKEALVFGLFQSFGIRASQSAQRLAGQLMSGVSDEEVITEILGSAAYLRTF